MRRAKISPTAERQENGIIKILIVGEYEQKLCATFRAIGYRAFSCDPQSAKINEMWHYRQDVMRRISYMDWDLIILRPDTSKMAIVGNKYYAEGKPRHQERLDQIEEVVSMWELAIQHSPRVAMEVAPCVGHRRMPQPWYVRPWQYGHNNNKRIGFILHGLPPLIPTNIVEKTGYLRRRDYQGIHDAIVDQWGDMGRWNIPRKH